MSRTQLRKRMSCFGQSQILKKVQRCSGVNTPAAHTRKRDVRRESLPTCTPASCETGVQGKAAARQDAKMISTGGFNDVPAEQRATSETFATCRILEIQIWHNSELSDGSQHTINTEAKKREVLGDKIAVRGDGHLLFIVQFLFLIPANDSRPVQHFRAAHPP